MVTLNKAQINVIKDYLTEVKFEYYRHTCVVSQELESLSFESRFGRIKLTANFFVKCINGALFCFERKSILKYDETGKYLILSTERRCLSCVEEEDVEDFAGVAADVPIYEIPEVDIVFRNMKSPEYYLQLMSV